MRQHDLIELAPAAGSLASLEGRTPTNSSVPFLPVGRGAYESAAFFAACSASRLACEGAAGVGALDDGGPGGGGELDAQRCW